jgi:hypothetical protein
MLRLVFHPANERRTDDYSEVGRRSAPLIA